MHLAVRGYLFVALIALLGVAGTWADEPAFASAWLFPAFLLLTGLAIEAWYLHGTRLDLQMRLQTRLKLGAELLRLLTDQGKTVVKNISMVIPISAWSARSSMRRRCRGRPRVHEPPCTSPSADTCSSR